MYIDVDDNITEVQDGPSLEIDGPPIIANKNIFFAHCGPFMKNWLLIFVLVHVSVLCPYVP